jgi:hypothetical protein
LALAGAADCLLLSLYTPHHDYSKQEILDWGFINSYGNHVIEIEDAFPPSWKKNRLNNVAIAVAPRYNFVVLYDDEGESEKHAL